MPPRAEINENGPICSWCGVRPDDPVWAQPRGQAKGIACLGCVADQRFLGASVRIIGKAYREQEATA
jgi:hypothetical protein